MVLGPLSSAQIVLGAGWGTIIKSLQDKRET